MAQDHGRPRVTRREAALMCLRAEGLMAPPGGGRAWNAPHLEPLVWVPLSGHLSQQLLQACSDGFPTQS